MTLSPIHLLTTTILNEESRSHEVLGLLGSRRLLRSAVIFLSTNMSSGDDLVPKAIL
jgi:hypothetical protein